MNLIDLFFLDNTNVNWSGDEPITFLAIFLVFIMLFSLIVTHFITKQKTNSKGSLWVQLPTSSNIKPNINKF